MRDITRIYFGTSGDCPVPADFNGDGSPNIAVFRASTGLWAVREISRCYFGNYSRRKKTLHPTMRMIHKAGEKMFVDWAGPTEDSKLSKSMDFDRDRWGVGLIAGGDIWRTAEKAQFQQSL